MARRKRISPDATSKPADVLARLTHISHRGTFGRLSLPHPDLPVYVRAFAVKGRRC